MNIPSLAYNVMFAGVCIGAYFIRLKYLIELHNCAFSPKNNNCFSQFMMYTNLISLLIISVPTLLLGSWNHVLIAIPILILINAQLLFFELKFLS